MGSLVWTLVGVVSGVVMITANLEIGHL